VRKTREKRRKKVQENEEGENVYMKQLNELIAENDDDDNQ
jgi:hypothetical protein